MHDDLIDRLRVTAEQTGDTLLLEAADAIGVAREDAQLLDFLASEARQIDFWPYGGRWEIPAIQIDSARDRCRPADLRSAIYDEYQSAITGGDT